MQALKERISTKDEMAEQIGLIVGIPETLYMWTVSFRSVAYLEHYNGQWVAWRETYQKGKRLSIGYKLISSGNTFSYVLKEFERYIRYVSRKRP